MFDTQQNQPRTAERALYSLAFLLFALRFLWPGDTVYILDEAYLQIRIDEHLAAGTFPLSNARGSSIALPYGPGAQWFYMFLRIFHWHPVFVALVHIFLSTAGALLFLRTLRRAYGPYAAAYCALAVASSPLLFFFSRHSWDNTLFIPLSAVALWLLQRLREGGPEVLLHALIGLVIGYCVNIHLMFGPVAVAMGFTLMLMSVQRHGLASRKPYLFLAAFGLAALLVLLPYLIEAAGIIGAEKPLENSRAKDRWGDGRNLWWLFQRTALFSSLFGSNVSFEGVKAEFLSFSGPIWAYFFRVDLFGWFGKLAAWFGAVLVLVNLLRGRVEKDPLLLFAALSFFFTLLVYQYLNIPTDPHYFNPVWWFVFVGIAWALIHLHGIWRRAFVLTLLCTITVNAAYLGFATAYIHENKGARNMQTSVVVGEQLRAFRTFCAWARQNSRSEVKIFREAIMGEPPYDYLPAHMPECQGIKLAITQDPALADFVVHHPRDSKTSAALVTTPGLL